MPSPDSHPSTAGSSGGEPPRVIAGRYEVLGTIGSGGLGRVLRARDRQLGRIVAVKTLVGKLDDRNQAILLREGRILGSLAGRHPTFVAVHDVLIDQGQVVIVQEFVEGLPLGKWQAGRPHAEILATYQQIADGLAVLHASGVVHRDLKPDNVLVRADGMPRILDFGLAVGTADRDELTGAGFIVGTPLYISPEGVQGHPLGPPADVFALGVMLFEALTGGSPWGEAFSVSTMVLERVKGVGSEARSRLAAATPTFVDLVTGMMDPDPKVRPSAATVASMLRLPDSGPTRVAPSPGPRASMSYAPAPLPPPISGYGRPPVAAAPAPSFGAAPSFGSTTMLGPPQGASVPKLGSITATAPISVVGAASTTLPGLATSARPNLPLALVLAAPLAALVLGVILVIQPGPAGLGDALKSMGLVVLGAAAALGTVLWLRRSQRRQDAAVAEALPLITRVSALEEQLRRTGQMSQSVAVNLHDVGQELDADRIADAVRRSVVAAFRELELQPGTKRSDMGYALDVISQLTSSKPKTPTASRMKKVGGYVALVSAATTAGAGLLGLLGTVNLWHANAGPVISKIATTPPRARRGATVVVEVAASDADNDALTFTGKATAGELSGGGPTFLWRAPTGAGAASIATISVQVSDGRKSAHQQVAVLVDTPPRLTLDGPTRVGTGAGALFVARAQDDDNDPLTYLWSFSAGEPQTASTATVTWRAPRRAEPVVVRLQVSDGIDSTEAQQLVRVGH